MEKAQRKSDIGFLAIVAAMVKQCMDKLGVCGISLYLEKRPGATWGYRPGVHLQAWRFMDYFGEDTNYEYITDRDGDMKVITDVNGVVFFALIDGLDLIQNGRLV